MVFGFISRHPALSCVASGGESIGCHGNAGAAGTSFDATLLSLKVSNNNVSTRTETPLLVFPTGPIWSNIFVENNAKVLVPLLWTRVQVINSWCLNFFLQQYDLRINIFPVFLQASWIVNCKGLTYLYFVPCQSSDPSKWILIFLLNWYVLPQPPLSLATKSSTWCWVMEVVKISV